MKQEDKHYLSIQKNREGIDFVKSGEKDIAYEYFCDAINLNPEYPPSYFNLGNILMEKKLYKKAIENYEKSNALDLKNNRYKFKLGVAYAESGEFKKSIKVFEKILNEENNNLEIMNNLGRLHKEINEYDTSIQYFEKAISIKYDFHKPYVELGILYGEIGELERSIHFLRKGLEIKKSFIKNEKLDSKKLIENKLDLASIYWNLSLSNLISGDYNNGFKNYEYRMYRSDPIMPHARPISQRITDKLSIKERTKILLISEQGLGDTIQFIRYSLYLKQIGFKVTLCCLKKLHSLVEFSNICDYLISPNDAVKIYDVPWVPLLSLPKLLKINSDNVLINDKYLDIPKNRIQYWKKIIKKDNKPLIGINWQGNPNAEKGKVKGRSITLEEFSVLKSSEYKFVSLQKGFGMDQLDKCSFKEYFIDKQEVVNKTLDFLDSAAIISCCDLVITSDSMNAHLSGSIGKETWLLLKYVPDWRWGMEKDSSHWYKSLKLYRQKSNNKWKDIFEIIAKDLKLIYPSQKS